MTRRLAAWSIALLVGASTGCPATAQESRPDPPVATIDGHPVTRAEMVRRLLAENLSAVTDALVLAAVLELELNKAGIKTTESDAGWEDLERLEDEAETRPTGSSTRSSINRQLFIVRRLQRYEILKRGQDPGPPAGLVAEVREKDGTGSRRMTDDQAVSFVLGNLQPGSLGKTAGDLVDSLLVDRELARAGKAVTAAEVEAWNRAMREKYKPPFDWREICGFKQTTPDREAERWRRVEAWKRVTAWKLDEKELREFFARNEEHFSGKHADRSRRRTSADLEDPEFRGWVVDELETKLLNDWLKGVRAKSRIWIAPDDELVRILKAK